MSQSQHIGRLDESLLSLQTSLSGQLFEILTLFRYVIELHTLTRTLQSRLTHTNIVTHYNTCTTRVSKIFKLAEVSPRARPTLEQ